MYESCDIEAVLTAPFREDMNQNQTVLQLSFI